MFEMQCVSAHQYAVRLVDGLLDPAREELASALGDRRSLVVTTPRVAALLAASLRTYARAHSLDLSILTVELDEEAKTLETVAVVCARAAQLGLGRLDPIVALGGGICCDVVSVAASLFRRGVPYLCLPTTLLGQVDAGIGLKGGVNFAGRKNSLGCFQPPDGVLMDTAWLSSLPKAEVRNGVAEILKIAVVADPDLFCLLEDHVASLVARRFAGEKGRLVIARAVELMLAALQENCFEDQSFERPVDFGHTFSNTLEERSGYELAHGQAVALDMALTVALGLHAGIVAPDLAERLVAVQAAAGLPVFSPQFSADLVSAAVASTAANRGGHLNLVVPLELGHVTYLADGSLLSDLVVSEGISWLREVQTRFDFPSPSRAIEGALAGLG